MDKFEMQRERCRGGKKESEREREREKERKRESERERERTRADIAIPVPLIVICCIAFYGGRMAVVKSIVFHGFSLILSTSPCLRTIRLSFRMCLVVFWYSR